MFNLIGFYDVNPEYSKKIEKEFGYKYFNNSNLLIDSSDAIAIITPTKFHYEIAMRCIEKNKHIFIEKPIAHNVAEAEELVKFSKEKKIIGQVGHVERFNPAYNSVKKMIGNPMFIESHRLSSYPSRGTDVSVVLDLMIHDIDIVLSLVDSKITKISANGTKIISSSPDIANARIEFENGCVANLTSSRLSLKKMRKMRVFQTDSYISLDFDSGSSEIIKIKNFDGKNNYAMTIHDSEGVEKEIQIENITNEKINSIEEEHKNFYYSIIKKEDPIVSFEKGRNALKLAIEILKIIEN